ncbi:hypothetical protein ACEU6E_08350 [Halorutilales archaeon Cl-col2-1]
MSPEIDSDTHVGVSYEDLQRLEDEGEALRFLKSRAEEIGVLSDSAETYVIKDLGRKHDVHIDFYSLPGKLDCLQRSKKEDHPPETEYVYIGSGKRDEVIADRAGWEYVELEDVAREFGWELSDD